MIGRRDMLKTAAAAALSAGVPRIARGAAANTLLVTHPAFLGHVTGPLNPERPARMTAIDAALADPAFAGLTRASAPLRDDVEAAILRVHSRAHYDRVAAAAADGAHLPMRSMPIRSCRRARGRRRAAGSAHVSWRWIA